MAAEKGEVIGIHTVDEWKDHSAKALESKKLVVVDFTAVWCGPCRIIAPIFAELAKKITDAIFFKVDVDELPSVAEDFKVEAMPTFLFLKEGKEIDRIVGTNKEELSKKIDTHLASA